MRAPARVITAVALGALLMVSASSSALGRSPQSFGPGVDFSSAQVSAIRIGNPTDKFPFDVPLVQIMTPRTSCALISTWLHAPVPDLPGYSRHCLVNSPVHGLVNRHRPDGTVNPIETDIDVYYVPTDVDPRTADWATASARGAVTVVLRYPLPDPAVAVPVSAHDLAALSRPVDEVDGGYAYGTIDGRRAVVQDSYNGEIPQSRVGGIADIGGDLYGFDANGGLGAARLLGFTARWLHQ